MADEGVAEMVARPPKVPKVRSLNLYADLSFIRAPIIWINEFKLVAERSSELILIA
jgi:hypothetical protein